MNRPTPFRITKTPLSAGIHSALLALVFLTPLALQAQDGAADDADTLESVIVTGSKIKRSDLETSQPVLSITREDIAATGVSQLGDILQNLASGGAAINQSFNNGGTGSTLVDLRDLGPNRTLVLVNGRRYAPDGVILSGAVDLNSIPTSIVERIEVLKDGASTIYGSDAIAGVINIITVDRFDGMEANAYIGETSEGDGRTESYDFTAGTANDKTSLIVNVSFQKNEAIFAGDRPISAVPQFGADFCASTTNPNGRFGFVGRPGTFTLTNTTPTAPGAVQSATNLRPFAIPADCYNFAPDNYLATPQERYALFAKVRHDIFDNLAFRSEVVYNNRTSDQLLAAIPVTFAGSGLFGPNVAFDISRDSFYNPFGANTTRVQRRLQESGGRRFASDVDVFHYSGGLEGYFDFADRPFSWDLGYNFSQNQSQNITTGQVNVSRIASAVGPSFRDATGAIRCGTPTNIIAGCVPLNLFGGEGSITPEMLRYISVPLQDTYEYRRTGYQANISGELFELPAGTLAFAAGYEYRKETGFDLPDALTATGASSGNIRQPTGGGFSTDEFFAEFSVPVLKDAPGAELLELSLASRYSDYSTFGDTTNSKLGVKWKPISDLLVRGNYSEGFLAPAIINLFQGRSDAFPAINDPCVGANQAVPANFASLTQAQQANCIANGVPFVAAPLPGRPDLRGAEQASGQIRNTVGGNDALIPEESESKTLGFVYSPDFFPGFDISVDWWSITIENSITSLGGGAILNACILGGAQNQCRLITRLPSTGAVTGILDINTNGAADEISGYDLTANYAFELSDYGRFRVTLDTTYLDEYITTTDSGIPDDPITFSLVGNYYSSAALTSRIKANAGLTWDLGDWGATYNLRYTSRLQELCTGAVNIPAQCSDLDPNGVGLPFNVDGLASNGLELGALNSLGGTTYSDIQLRWSAPWNAKISGGIRNLFDKDPPISISTFANSFDPSYDVPGRFFYMSYNQKF